MHRATAWRWLLGLFAAASMAGTTFAAAEKRTVCTITVNSADEKDAIRRHLPASKFQFVELVERGRPDWLARACQARVACDVLVVSGHFDGVEVFFSDRPDASEHLPLAELERVSCSQACPSLFARLKEVYLFGCNTLNPRPQRVGSGEIVRNLVRDGVARDEAHRQLEALATRFGASSRERMRQIFKDVPLIYGFAAMAPNGPIAAAALDRYFGATGTREFGHGRRSARLLARFEPQGMTSSAGVTEQDALADVRRDLCTFADLRLTVAEQLDFVHRLLQRPTGEARIHLERIRSLVGALDGVARLDPATAARLREIARDREARTRFIELARDADQPLVRTRMLDLARELGWLTDEDRRAELALMFDELLTRGDLGMAEIDLACTLNPGRELDAAFARRIEWLGLREDAAHAAVRACLGSAEARARTLAALSGTRDTDVRAAQTYLRQRPIADALELRRLATAIVQMEPSPAQVRALDTLARHYLSDAEIVNALLDLFAATPSAAVQGAIAGALMRAEPRAIPRERALRVLREHRHRGPDGEAPNDVDGDARIDALIDRLQ